MVAGKIRRTGVESGRKIAIEASEPCIVDEKILNGDFTACFCKHVDLNTTKFVVKLSSNQLRAA
jgi:hypothetical protein